MERASIEALTYLVNHPHIRAAVGLKEGEMMNMEKVYANPRNVGFSCPLGAMLFGYEEDGVYDCHFLFIPGSPAKAVRLHAKAMLDEMFTKHKAHVIYGKPPRDNRAVRILGIPLGFTKLENSEFTDGFGRKCEIYEMRKEQWLH